MTLVLFLFSCLTGSVIQTVSGFGFGIFVQAIFPYFMPSTSVGVAISALLSMVLSFIVAFRYRKFIDIKTLLPALAGFFVTSAVAILYFADKPDTILKKMLAVVLIVMSIYFFFFSDKIKIRPTVRNGVVAGALGGILGGLFGMGGPPMVVYLLGVQDEPEKYMCNIQCYFTVTNLFATIIRVFAGIINVFVIKYWLIGLVAVFAGIYFGRKIFNKLSAALLRKLVYGFMAVSGIIMLF